MYTRRLAGRWPIKTQPTIEGKRLSHSYVNSYESPNIEEKIILVTPGQCWLIVVLWWGARWEWARRGDARVCVRGSIKTKKSDPKNKHDPEQSTIIHDPYVIC